MLALVLPMFGVTKTALTTSHLPLTLTLEAMQVLKRIVVTPKLALPNV